MKRVLKKIPMLFLLIFFSCSSQESITLGSKMNNNLHSPSKILIPSGAFLNSVAYEQNNISFIVGIDENKTIKYISTVDPKFEIEGLKVNNNLSKFFDDSKVHYIVGWGYYLRINSDWFAGFDINSKPNESTKIQWFFKYDFLERNKNLFKR